MVAGNATKCCGGTLSGGAILERGRPRCESGFVARRARLIADVVTGVREVGEAEVSLPVAATVPGGAGDELAGSRAQPAVPEPPVGRSDKLPSSEEATQ